MIMCSIDCEDCKCKGTWKENNNREGEMKSTLEISIIHWICFQLVEQFAQKPARQAVQTCGFQSLVCTIETLLWSAVKIVCPIKRCKTMFINFTIKTYSWKATISCFTQHTIPSQFPKRLNAMIDSFICLLILHSLKLGRVIQCIDYYERITSWFFGIRNYCFCFS